MKKIMLLLIIVASRPLLCMNTIIPSSQPISHAGNLPLANACTVKGCCQQADDCCNGPANKCCSCTARCVENSINIPINVIGECRQECCQRTDACCHSPCCACIGGCITGSLAIPIQVTIACLIDLCCLPQACCTRPCKDKSDPKRNDIFCALSRTMITDPRWPTELTGDCGWGFKKPEINSCCGVDISLASDTPAEAYGCDK